MRIFESMLTMTCHIADIQGIASEKIMKLLQSSLCILLFLFAFRHKCSQNEKHGTVAYHHVAAPAEILGFHGKGKAAFLHYGKKSFRFCKQ